MAATDKITRSDHAYPTIIYHLVRLKMAMGEVVEARKILNRVIAEDAPSMPISAQNQFLEKRAQLARGMNDFLKASQHKPVAFYRYGSIATVRELLEVEKESWDPKWSNHTREQHEEEAEKEFKDLLPWDDRFIFDARTVDILNWHFSVASLIEAARNPNLPDYLQRNLMLAGWTRAIVLRNDKAALEIAPDVLQLAPELGPEFGPYMKAETLKERRQSALYVLLKHAGLSPYLIEGLPEFPTNEELDYYLETSWWCPLDLTDYTDEGKEFPRAIPKPSFLSPVELETARRERVAMLALGDAKSYLGKQVLEWARTSPSDPRLPEALFIAVKANESYKYGCDSWNFDEVTRNKALSLLRKRFPLSPWTVKLKDEEDNN